MNNGWYTVPHENTCTHSCMRCMNHKGEKCDKCYDMSNKKCWYMPNRGIHRITLESGRQYTGKTHEELVCKLAKDMWVFKGMSEYMRGVAHRCKIWDGSEIDIDNCRSFIDNLIRVGVIVKYEVCEAY